MTTPEIQISHSASEAPLGAPKLVEYSSDRWAIAFYSAEHGRNLTTFAMDPAAAVEALTAMGCRFCAYCRERPERVRYAPYCSADCEAGDRGDDHCADPRGHQWHTPSDPQRASRCVHCGACGDI